MQLMSTQEELPLGSHSLSFYANRPEAAYNMASFLKGAQRHHQSAMILTSDDEMMELYQAAVEREVPQMLGALHRIPGPHIRASADGLRPVPEVREFAAAHPEGGTMCGDTIPGILDRRNLPNILVYEDWFDSLRPFYHRGLCPYDLNHIPVDRAPDALTSLVHSHTHAVLSRDPDPAAQFVQLLILPAVENPPETHLGWLARAADRGLVVDDRLEGEAAQLTPRGETFVRALRALPSLSRRTPRPPTMARGQQDPRSPRFSPEE